MGQDVHGGITVVNRAAPAESAPGGGGNVADEPGTSLGAVRDLLLDAFSAEELRGLFLYAESPALRPATYEFGPNEGVGAMADEAILFCHRRGLLPDLLAEVERARPEKFKLYAARLRGEG